MTKQKYQKGDRVKVLIGHRMWSSGMEIPGAKLLRSGDKFKEYDISPHLTEDIATVQYTYGEMSEIDERFSKGDDGYKSYCLKFDKNGTISWFEEDVIIPLNK